MEKYTENFADEIVQLCISKYDSLGKSGKPKNETEWTLLSCFVQEEQCSHTLKVVALGTGSKCIGSQQLPSDGDVLHDSHAEVIARRAFMLYLINQMRKATEGNGSIFEIRDRIFYLKAGIFFHFYTSHTPCGDASIFPKHKLSECVGNILKTEAGQTLYTSTSIPPETGDLQSSYDVTVDNLDIEPAVKKRRHLESGYIDQVNVPGNVNTYTGRSDMKLLYEDIKERDMNFDEKIENTVNTRVKENDLKSCNDCEKECSCTTKYGNRKHVKGNTGVIDASLDTFRTGAKCVVGEVPDLHLPGSNYHVTGVLRTKPGRGDPTLSLSCSDKIFKWTVLGVQGALPMILLKMPVYLMCIVIGRCPYSDDAMKRAIYHRFREDLKDASLPDGFSLQTPVLLQSHIDFPHSRNYIARTASEGIKLMPTPTSMIWSDTSLHKESQEVTTNGRRLGCTKKNLGTPKSWVSICRKAISCLMLDLLKDTGWKQSDLSQISYRDFKGYSKSYIQAWNILKTKCLANWTVKPKHLKDFKVV